MKLHIMILATVVWAAPALASAVPPILPLSGSWGGSGSGPGQFSHPSGVAVAPNGDVYVADRDNRRVQYFTESGVFLGQWGGSGTGPGLFQSPRGIAIDGAGMVYVTDAVLNNVQKFTSTGGYLATFAEAHIQGPVAIAVDVEGSLYVGSGPLHVVSKFGADGPFLLSFDTSFNWGVDIDSHGCVFVSNYSVYVQRFTAAGALESFWSPMGGFPEDHLLGVAVDAADNALVVFAGWPDRILVQSHALAYLDQWFPMAPPGGVTPGLEGIACAQGNAVYLTDYANNAVLKFDYSAPVPTIASTWSRMKAMYR
jgi:tripartite motif-containing protein 71